LHLDAEVAGENYANAGITDPVNDLPCSKPCPPPEASTNALRDVMLRWIGEAHVPPKTVLCTPSMQTETWVLCALYPRVAVAIPGNLECFRTPDRRLQAQPQAGRLVRSGKKNRGMYQKRAGEVAQAWDQVRRNCSEAERFSSDLRVCVSQA
jgi:hypothetical protein